MAEVTQQQVVEYIKGISVLELSQLVKTLESELGVSAAAAMPMAMPAGGGGRRRGGSGRREDRVHRHADRSRRQQDQRHQGRPRDHQPGSQGSQGPRRRRAEADQGRRAEGRGRRHQEEVRRGRREGRSQVTLGGVSAASDLVGARLSSRPWSAGRSEDRPLQALDLLRGLKHVQPSQERLPRAHRFFENQDDRSDPEPDRDPEEVLRALPADEPSAERARGRGSAVGVQVGLPDQRLPRELVARVHRVFDRQLGVQVRQAAGAASPAQAVQQLRRHAHCRPVRRPRGAVPALRQGQPGARRRLRHLRQHGRR